MTETTETTKATEATTSAEPSGPWVPPAVAVRLIELTNNDQLAVSLTPIDNGQLKCEARPVAAFDVVLSLDSGLE